MLALRFLPSLDHEMWGEAANAESGKKPLPPSIIPFPPPCTSGTFILGDEGRLENSPSLRRQKESEHFFPLLLRERGTERLSKAKKGRTRGGDGGGRGVPSVFKKREPLLLLRRHCHVGNAKGGGETDDGENSLPSPLSFIVRKERKIPCSSSSGNFSVTGVGGGPNELRYRRRRQKARTFRPRKFFSGEYESGRWKPGPREYGTRSSFVAKERGPFSSRRATSTFS